MKGAGQNSTIVRWLSIGNSIVGRLRESKSQMGKRFHGNPEQAFDLDFKSIAEQLASPMPKAGEKPNLAKLVKELKDRAAKRKEKLKPNG